MLSTRCGKFLSLIFVVTLAETARPSLVVSTTVATNVSRAATNTQRGTRRSKLLLELLLELAEEALLLALTARRLLRLWSVLESVHNRVALLGCA